MCVLNVLNTAGDDAFKFTFGVKALVLEPIGLKFVLNIFACGKDELR